MTPAAAPHATHARLQVGDPLRALAALGVVVLHAVVTSVVETGYYARLQTDRADYLARLFGTIGHVFNGLYVVVDVFFVLSGYLLARPFLRAFIADEQLPSISGYLRNRALRVVPAFWFVLLAVIVLDGAHGDSWLEVLGFAAFAQDAQRSGLGLAYGQVWSLLVEVRFYLLLPVAGLALYALRAWLGARLPRVTRLALVTALVVVGFYASHTVAVSEGGLGAGFAANALFFVPGILLALLEHVVPDRVRGRGFIAALAVLIFAAGLVVTLASRYLGFHLGRPASTYVVPLGTGAIVAGPLLWQWTGRRAWQVLDNRVLRWIGRRSYPLFLVHGLVLVMLAPHLVSGGYKTTLLVVGPVCLAVSLLAADLIHRFVERPALRHKRDYAPGRTRATPTAIPAC